MTKVEYRNIFIKSMDMRKKARIIYDFISGRRYSEGELYS
ncbi:hypothetical protein MIDIC_20008 [Alphaproteobacteria bacterium]